MPPPVGQRPVVLLSRDEAYIIRDVIIVAAVTTRVRGIPAEGRLGPEDGLPRACVVNLDVLYSIPKASLQKQVAHLSLAKLQAVEVAIHFALGLET